MRRPPDWLIYLLIVFMIYLNATRSSDGTDAPPPPPELGPILPAETPRDQAVIVDMNVPKSGVGTAFAVDDSGKWITAKHVVDGCEAIGLQLDSRRIVRAEATLSPDTDLAVLTTEWARKPLATDIDGPRQLGEAGYFFGFPQGRPGEASGTLLGRHRMIIRGRYKSEEAILAWTETGRTRGLRGSLGGMSGGPAFDADGEVVGVVSAESPRRGRIYTVAPRSLRSILKTNNGVRGSAISKQNYGLQADRLRRDRRIAQVICIVN